MNILILAFVGCLSSSAATFDFAEKVVRGEERSPASVTTNASGHVLVDFGRHAFGWIEQDVPSAMQITSGIPIVMDPKTAVGSIDLESISAWSASSSKLLEDYARADALSGGRLAVLPAEPLQGWLMPRVAPDGTLRVVTYVNTTFDRSWPTKLRLRGVGESVCDAQWFGLDGGKTKCPVSRQGGKTFVVLPEVDPWNGGYLAFTE